METIGSIFDRESHQSVVLLNGLYGFILMLHLHSGNKEMSLVMNYWSKTRINSFAITLLKLVTDELFHFSLTCRF